MSAADHADQLKLLSNVAERALSIATAAFEQMDQLQSDPDVEEDDTREDDDPREDADPAEQDDPGEPSLASPERHDGYGNGWGGVSYASSQTRWAQGSRSDRELTEDTQEGDELEERGELDDSQDEPSLGWQDSGDQTQLRVGGNDLEQDAGDQGEAGADQDNDGEFKGGTIYGADEKAPHDCGGHTAWS